LNTPSFKNHFCSSFLLTTAPSTAGSKSSISTAPVPTVRIDANSNSRDGHERNDRIEMHAEYTHECENKQHCQNEWEQAGQTELERAEVFLPDHCSYVISIKDTV